MCVKLHVNKSVRSLLKAESMIKFIIQLQIVLNPNFNRYRLLLLRLVFPLSIRDRSSLFRIPRQLHNKIYFPLKDTSLFPAEVFSPQPGR
jgi:hypothetical protein